jgi:hypothetical protein
MPFRGPMPDPLMTKDEIRRRLRFVQSQQRGHRPLTMQAIAVRCQLSRVAVHDAANGIMGDQVQHVLSQVLREVPVQEMIADSWSLHELMTRAVRPGS